MSKVDVYAATSYDTTLIWTGEMSCIPRAGDVIFFHEDFGGQPVKRVYWELTDNSVEIHIDDLSGELSEAAIETSTNGDGSKKQESPDVQE